MGSTPLITPSDLVHVESGTRSWCNLWCPCVRGRSADLIHGLLKLACLLLYLVFNKLITCFSFNSLCSLFACIRLIIFLWNLAIEVAATLWPSLLKKRLGCAMGSTLFLFLSVKVPACAILLNKEETSITCCVRLNLSRSESLCNLCRILNVFGSDMSIVLVADAFICLILLWI